MPREAHGQARPSLVEGRAYWMRTRRPWVMAKYAMTLDGKIATRAGHAHWISGPEARAWVHRLRNQVDAILVGRGTVETDDPRLTTRLPDARSVRHPLRVVLDSRGRAPLTARVFSGALPGRTVVAATDALPRARRAALQARGVDVWALPPDASGRVSLPALLDALGARGVATLLVEGGPTVLGAFFDAALLHQSHVFVAPALFGGATAPSAIGGQGVARADRAPRLRRLRVERMGDDVLITGYLVRERA